MANVEHYLPFLLKWEGGYSDDPADRGGSTYMGVTLTTYRRLHPEAGAEDLKRMTDSDSIGDAVRRMPLGIRAWQRCWWTGHGFPDHVPYAMHKPLYTLCQTEEWAP